MLCIVATLLESTIYGICAFVCCTSEYDFSIKRAISEETNMPCVIKGLKHTTQSCNYKKGPT